MATGKGLGGRGAVSSEVQEMFNIFVLVVVIQVFAYVKNQSINLNISALYTFCVYILSLYFKDITNNTTHKLISANIFILHLLDKKDKNRDLGFQ